LLSEPGSAQKLKTRRECKGSWIRYGHTQLTLISIIVNHSGPPSRIDGLCNFR